MTSFRFIYICKWEKCLKNEINGEVKRGWGLENKIEYLGVDDLMPYKNNARTHSESQIKKIAASMKEFSFIAPVVINDENMILAGHGRLIAAKQIGLQRVPVVRVVHLTQAQQRAYILADNRIADDAGWDDELLKIELSELNELEFDLAITGFEDEELNNLIFEDEEDAFLTDEDDCPDANDVHIVTVKGDIWQIGEHKLLCGDSTILGDVEKLMDGEQADLLITDPPYNVNYEGKTSKKLKIQNDSMSETAFRQFLSDAYSNANVVMKSGAVFYIWHAASESYNFYGAAIDVGWDIKQSLIWSKNNIVLGRQDYHWKHEPCLYGWKSGKHYWGSDRKQTTILEFNKPVRNAEHPTMKPVDLIQYQIENSSRKNEIVLDLFGGSGTTLIAAEKTSRKARLIELDTKYCDVIVKRWQNLTGKEAIHLESGKTFNQLLNAADEKISA